MENLRRAVVTGASSGIGAAFASELASLGYDLTLVARRDDKLQALAEELHKRHSTMVRVFVADLSNVSDLERLEDYIASLDGLEILINNAGFGTFGKFTEVDLNKHLAMINVHDVACLRLCRAALPGMISRGKGSIVNVSSIAALLPAPNSAVYCATKAFITVFSEALACEVEGKGVRIQALCPGFTYTEFHDTPEYKNFSRSQVPSWMWMKASDVARLSLKALEKRRVIYVPGFLNRALLWLTSCPVVSTIMRLIIKACRKGTKESGREG